jgi:uncharacterized membrane protein (DUF373 family)
MGGQTSHTAVHQAARRFLEPIQDLIVLGIGLALFGVMLRALGRLVRDLFGAAIDFRVVIAEVLFILVLVEVVRLLIVYLQEHRVAVDFMVELGIVASLREIVLRGVTELDWKQVVAVTMFLVALGALLRFGDLRLAARLPQASAPRGERGGADARPSSPPVESVSGDSAGR